MGASFYISLERQIEDIDPLDMDGKAVCRAAQALETLAQRLGITPLMSFLSADPADLANYGDDLPEEAIADLPPRTYFPAEDGLKTVRALCNHLRQNPNAVPNGGEALVDLFEFEKILARAVEEDIRWHLAGDA
jgi:hypothetical protein